MKSYRNLILERKQKYGKQFSSKDLDRRFVRYYESGERIKVTYKYGKINPEIEVKTGTVGITTGWKPVFLLILTSRSLSSSWILDKSVKKIEVLR